MILELYIFHLSQDRRILCSWLRANSKNVSYSGYHIFLTMH